MKNLYQTCAMAFVLVLSACGGSTSAEDNTTDSPASVTEVPINPLPLSERS